MFGQSNDLFFAPGEQGIALFDSNGHPRSGDVTSDVALWDTGTEVNEAPGEGPNQAARQSGPNTGPAEGVVSLFTNSTRALPAASGVVDVAVIESGGVYTLTVANVSAMRGSIVTPIAPILYATHDATWSLFTVGGAASAGVEHLAEDGSPAQALADETGAPGVGMIGVQALTMERPADSPGPAQPGEHFQFTVAPDAAHPYLTLASMVGQTNDAFWGTDPMGIRLLDQDGNPRPAADVSSDFANQLAIWDAGTEANQVPGVGLTQAPRQPAPNTGPADPNPQVRRYADSTNDLAGPNLGGYAMVSIEPAAMADSATDASFVVTVMNTSDNIAYTGLLSPVVWAVHDASMHLFTPGMPASTGIERVAEDGNATPLATQVSGEAGVLASGVANQPDGGSPAPLAPGQVYTFTVTPDMDHPFLSLASMVAPSNDTFMAFGPDGIRLLDEQGAPRSSEDIAADIEASLAAWDAGTEHNQSGAIGPDQTPRQAGPDTGANEGNGTVRLLDDTVWRYPAVNHAIRVTLTPIQRYWLPLVVEP